MATQPKLTAGLRAEYQQLFDSCQIRPERIDEIDRTAQRIEQGRARFEKVGKPLGVPWFVIGVMQQMEGGGGFDRHLHNGDPLTARTVHVPKGRPLTGNPPFSWEDSARDALASEGFAAWSDWSLPGILYRLESYNGFGYRQFHPEVKSPYLWSFTNQYQRGKYVADGTWSASAVSKQAGAAAMLRRLAERGAVSVASHPVEPDLMTAMQAKGAALRFKPDAVQPGALELQQFLNRFPGLFLREDGQLGPRSSDAFKQVFGMYLRGDPRGG